MSPSSLAFKNMFPRSPSVAPLSDFLFPPRTTTVREYGSGEGHRGRSRSPFHLYGEQQKYTGREVWEGKENEDGLYLRLDMPGVGKENIKVRFEGDKLVMQGQGEKDFEDHDFGPSYNYSCQLLEVHLYDTKAVRADVVNGVLKVFVPKL